MATTPLWKARCGAGNRREEDKADLGRGHEMSATKDAFHIELSLARMAVGMANRHRSDLGCDGLVHQVRRLEKHYREQPDTERADKLARILAWFDAGGPEPTDSAVLSFIEQ